MKDNHIDTITDSELIEYIESNAGVLTPREVQQLVNDLPDVRERFYNMRNSPFIETERYLWFFSHVVERVWTEQYRDMPYRAALEAAFAIVYFDRDADLIPDTLGSIGLIDDCAVVQTVLARNLDAYAKFRAATKLDWENSAIVPSNKAQS